MEITSLNIPRWTIEEELGYHPITTFWQDFSIADRFGIPSVEDTFNRAFKEWRTNYKYLTELVMVLNHKIFQHYKTNRELAKVYDGLWREADAWGCENLKDEELDYFIRTLD